MAAFGDDAQAARRRRHRAQGPPSSLSVDPGRPGVGLHAGAGTVLPAAVRRPASGSAVAELSCRTLRASATSPRRWPASARAGHRPMSCSFPARCPSEAGRLTRQARAAGLDAADPLRGRLPTSPAKSSGGHTGTTTSTTPRTFRSRQRGATGPSLRHRIPEAVRPHAGERLRGARATTRCVLIADAIRQGGLRPSRTAIRGALAGHSRLRDGDRHDLVRAGSSDTQSQAGDLIPFPGGRPAFSGRQCPRLKPQSHRVQPQSWQPSPTACPRSAPTALPSNLQPRLLQVELPLDPVHHVVLISPLLRSSTTARRWTL